MKKLTRAIFLIKFRAFLEMFKQAERSLALMKNKQNSIDREFIEKCQDYRNRLTKCNPDGIWKLFRQTSIPYSMSQKDPSSMEYREEVLQLYKHLAGEEYKEENELTSNKQSAESFDRGFPWTVNDYELIANESSKHTQFFRTLSKFFKFKTLKILEFGAGWGNLTIPMVLSGMDVTAIDIDALFLERIQKRVDFHKQKIKLINADFHDGLERAGGAFDCVVFQSCFHHCLDFEKLLDRLVDRLSDEGIILFLDEPIIENYNFPWGLRYDGESLWAIMFNKWLELGFDHDYFVTLLMKRKLVVSKIPSDQPLYRGQGFCASRGNIGLNFSDVALPRCSDETFHTPRPGDKGRFTKSSSSLPAITGTATYEISMINYRTKKISVKIISSSQKVEIDLQPLESYVAKISVHNHPVTILSETFIPRNETMSDDSQELGVFIDHLKILQGN